MKMRNSMIALALMLMFAFSATAQEKAKADVKAVPKLVVESFTHDFGEVKPGLPLSYSFKIKNVGKADLEIRAVQPG